VSTTTSGIPELVEDGITGFLAPPNNHAALAAQIQRCCDLDAGLRETILRAARRRVERNHDARKLAWALLDMLTSSAPSVVAKERYSQYV
jgi:colanic acid/amylovoran biosynthesis glycosyltransferase